MPNALAGRAAANQCLYEEGERGLQPLNSGFVVIYVYEFQVMNVSAPLYF